jgi:hypothetical protein
MYINPINKNQNINSKAKTVRTPADTITVVLNKILNSSVY